MACLCAGLGRRFWIALVALFLAVPLAAHPAPFSYLDLSLGDDGVHGQLTIHTIDAAHELGVANPDSLLDHNVLHAREGELIAALEPHLELRDGAGRRLQPAWSEMAGLPDKQAIAIPFRIMGPPPAELSVRTSLFAYDPQHQSFVNIYEGGELRQQWIFSRSSPARVHYAGSAAGVWAVMRTFVPTGVHHILIGPDHVLFLVGLLLLGGTMGALVRIVTAFTLGHSVTLALSALDIVTFPATLVEPVIALTIVFIGADNLLRGQGKDLRAWLAFAFGLVHGFGFASVLKEFGLPQEALGWSLFSFNVGVELGQLLLVVPLAFAVNAIRRRSAIWGNRVAQGGSLIVILAGLYWYVQRVLPLGGS